MRPLHKQLKQLAKKLRVEEDDDDNNIIFMTCNNTISSVFDTKQRRNTYNEDKIPTDEFLANVSSEWGMNLTSIYNKSKEVEYI